MIGKRMKYLRKKIGLTQSELGKQLGVVKQTVSSWENNISEPKGDILIQLSKILNTSPNYLLGKSDENILPNEFEWKYTVPDDRLGGILKRFRDSKGITLSEFAKSLDICPETYMYIEMEKFPPSIQLLKKIADITKYDIDFLTGAINHTTIPTNDIIKINGQTIPVSYSESDFTFRAHFEELCSENKVDTENCEEKLSFTKNQFIDIKCNRMPTLSELLKISYAFKVSMDYIIGNITYKDDCALKAFRQLEDDDDKDILIGEIKKYLKEQRCKSVAADRTFKNTGTDGPKK